MQKKRLRILLGILLSLQISGCAIAPPDVPLCTELSPTKGFCVNTISSKEYEITDTKKLDGKTWWEIRPFMINMPISSWVEIKKFIIKICKKSNKCSKNISSWKRTVNTIDKKMAKKK